MKENNKQYWSKVVSVIVNKILFDLMNGNIYINDFNKTTGNFYNDVVYLEELIYYLKNLKKKTRKKTKEKKLKMEEVMK